MRRQGSSGEAKPWQSGALILGMSEQRIFIGTAAWAVPKQYDDAFPSEGSHLVRYASRFDGVEINSSFYRPHRLSTYQRWAADVPDHFRFAVKMPKTITHEGRLSDVDEPLQRFLGEIAGLGPKLGPVLVQLSPNLKFDPTVVRPFVERLRASFAGDVVWEPRHASWFTADVDAFLVDQRIARVAADPKPHPVSGAPGGWTSLVLQPGFAPVSGSLTPMAVASTLLMPPTPRRPAAAYPERGAGQEAEPGTRRRRAALAELPEWVISSRSGFSMNVGITPLKRTKLIGPGSARSEPKMVCDGCSNADVHPGVLIRDASPVTHAPPASADM